MNPEQILAAMTEMYAGCATYRDRGQVVMTWHHVEGPHRTCVRPFETAFIRPDRFRFEYRDRFTIESPWDRHIISAEAGIVRRWCDIRSRVEHPASLALALAAATGVSSGSAHTIPRLLMPDQTSGRVLTDLVDLAPIGDVQIGNVTCYRLRGRPRSYSDDPGEYEPITHWIERGTFLLRRIEEYDPESACEQVTEYEPEVGVTITEEELRFDPPQVEEAEN